MAEITSVPFNHDNPFRPDEKWNREIECPHCLGGFRVTKADLCVGNPDGSCYFPVVASCPHKGCGQVIEVFEKTGPWAKDLPYNRNMKPAEIREYLPPGFDGLPG